MEVHMATKADFTEQEWETLEKGVTGAGFLVALSDRGFFDTFKEAGALSRHLRDARANQSSELVREFAETRGTGFGLTDSPDEVESETTAALGGAMRVLDEKAPEEKEAYRQFVLDVAQSVADAAGGGEAAESATIEKIRAAVS
jgi:tellurite resistance protein